MRRAAYAAAGVVALTGCGGDDRPSRDEFAAEAEKVCADLERRSDELSRTRPQDDAEIVEFATGARSAAQDAVKRIRELDVPEGGDGEKAEQWQAAVVREADDQLIPALDDLEQAARDGDDQAILAAAQRIQGLESTESDGLAREIGAEGCAN